MIPRAEKLSHQPEHAFVGYPTAQLSQKQSVMDAPETVFDVSLDHPLVTSGRVDEVPHFFDGVLCSAPGPETVRGRSEIGLEDRLQHEHQRHLHDPVGKSGDAELAHLPRPALEDRVLAHRQRRVGARPERLAKLVQEPLHTLPLDAFARDEWLP
jgi:hypothetical protein